MEAAEGLLEPRCDCFVSNLTKEGEFEAVVRVRGPHEGRTRLTVRTVRKGGVLGDGTGERTAVVMVRSSHVFVRSIY